MVEIVAGNEAPPSPPRAPPATTYHQQITNVIQVLCNMPIEEDDGMSVFFSWSLRAHLARLYQEADEYEQAISLQQHLLTDLQSCEGENICYSYLLELSVHYDLATSFFVLEDYDEAIAATETCVSRMYTFLQLGLYVPQHVHTEYLASLFRLVESKHYYDKAVLYGRALLEHMFVCLANHETMESEETIAKTSLRLANCYFMRVISLLPQTARRYTNVADLFCMTEASVSCMLLDMEFCLERCALFYGPRHDTTLATKFRLAYIYFLAKQLPRALELCRDCLETNIVLFGESSLDTVRVRIYYALFLGTAHKREFEECGEAALRCLADASAQIELAMQHLERLSSADGFARNEPDNTSDAESDQLTLTEIARKVHVFIEESKRNFCIERYANREQHQH